MSALAPEPRQVEFHADCLFVYFISEFSIGDIYFIGQFTGSEIYAYFRLNRSQQKQIATSAPA